MLVGAVLVSRGSSSTISGACIHPSTTKQVLSALTALNISNGSFRIITKDNPKTDKQLTQVHLVSLNVLLYINCVALCTVCVSMCTVLLPTCVNPIAVNKYIYPFSSCFQVSRFQGLLAQVMHIRFQIISTKIPLHPCIKFISTT